MAIARLIITAVTIVRQPRFFARQKNAAADTAHHRFALRWFILRRRFAATAQMQLPDIPQPPGDQGDNKNQHPKKKLTHDVPENGGSRNCGGIA
ncbi:MAG: hypothetical protein FWC38_10580 [Proteobacteria bacterium]|nr:hypothetical protein [Pseudomonadota bacterium]MCL2308637.1 hypothetical protein [Pseudomonadota bacterium]